VQSAQLDNTGTTVIVKFDLPTNKLFTAGGDVTCFPWLYFAQDGAQSDIGLLCAFADSYTLIVKLNAVTQFSLNGTVRVTASSAFPLMSAYGISNYVAGSAKVSAPAQPPVPQVSILGPNTISACGTPPQLTSAVVNQAGRALAAVQWSAAFHLVNGSATPMTAIANAVNATLALPRASDLPVNATGVVDYQVSVTNWLGYSAASTVFTVTFAAQTVVTVSISSPPFTTSADAPLSLSCSGSMPLECVQTGFSGYVASWNVTDASGNLVATAQTSNLQLPAGALPPSTLANPRYTLTCRIDPVFDAGVSPSILASQSSVTAIVLAAPLVVQTSPRGLTTVSEGASTPAVFSAAASCDPNLAQPVCFKSTGTSDVNFAPAPLLFHWSCVDANNASCACIALGTCPVNASQLVVPAAEFTAARSPFSVFVTITSAQTADRTANSSALAVLVLAAVAADCPRPALTLAPVPPVLNLGPASLVLPISALTSDPLFAGRYVWQQINDDGSVCALCDVGTLVGAGASVVGPSLVLLARNLAQGATYTLQVTAVLDCTHGADASARVSFRTNAGPTGGLLTVTPSTGAAALDNFLLMASAFASSSNLPLLYSFARIDGGSLVTMRTFTSDASLQTTLPLIDGGVKLVAIASDVYGAQSGLQATATVATYKPVIDVSHPPDLSELVQNSLLTGGSSSAGLQVVTSLASVAASASPSSSGRMLDALAEWQANTLATGLNIVAGYAASTASTVTRRRRRVLAATQADGASATADSAQQASTLQALTALLPAASSSSGDRRRLDDGSAVLAQVTSTLGDIVDTCVEGVTASKTSTDDPLTASYVPANIGSAVQSTIANVLGAVAPTASPSNAGALNTTVDAARFTLRSLANLLMQGAVSGGSPTTIPGASMASVVLVEHPVVLASSSVQFVLPPVGGQQVRIRLPAGVLAQLVNATSGLVKILATRFAFNVDELVNEGVLAGNTTSDDAGSAPNVTQLTSLDFIDADNTVLHPSDLTSYIEVDIPILFDDVPPDGPVSIQLNATANITRNYTMTCGFFSSDAQWSGFGCNVTAVVLPANASDLSGFVTCACNHASDYAAWSAFEQDISDFGHFDLLDVTALATIGIVVLAVMLPCILVAWLIVLVWARRRDKNDADLVHKGSFVVIAMNKIRLHDRQRRFFALLRQRDLPPLNRPARDGTANGKAAHAELWRIWDDFKKGFWYDSTLLGLRARFDPYYERTQRVSVVVTVWLGSLTAAALFLTLSEADVSAGLFIARVLAASFMVSVPIKIFMRVLFRLSSARQGSTMDRAVQIFRITAFSNDVVPSFANIAQKADVELLLGFRRLYLAKHRLRMLEDILKYQKLVEENRKRAERGLPPRWTWEDVMSRSVGVSGVVLALCVLLQLIGLGAPNFVTTADGAFEPVNYVSLVLGVLSLVCYSLGMMSVVALFRAWALTNHLFRILLAASMTGTCFSVAAFALPLGQDADLAPALGLSAFIAAGACSAVAMGLVLFASAVFFNTDPDFVVRFERSTEQHRGLQTPVGGSMLPNAFKEDVQRNPALAAGYQKGPVGLTVSVPLVAKDDVVRNPALAAGYAKGPVGLPAGLKQETVDKKTHEFAVGDAAGGPPATEKKRRMTFQRVMSMRSNMAAKEQLYHHHLVFQSLTATNGVVTDEVIRQSQTEVHDARVQLKAATVLCQTHRPSRGVSNRKAVVRAQRRMLLKLVALLAETPSVRKEEPSQLAWGWLLLILAWLVLLAYVFGLTAYLIIWVFSLQSKERNELWQDYNSTLGTAYAEESPTNADISAATNYQLLQWLQSAFVTIALAYFFIEPIIIMIRFAIFPAILRKYGQEPQTRARAARSTMVTKRKGAPALGTAGDVENGVAGTAAVATAAGAEDNDFGIYNDPGGDNPLVLGCLDFLCDLVQQVS